MYGVSVAADASTANTPPSIENIPSTIVRARNELRKRLNFDISSFSSFYSDHNIKLCFIGDTLTVRLYVKSSFYLFGGRFDLLLDRNVFDIMNGEASGWLAKGEDLVEGKVYPTNGYKVVFSKSPLSEIHPEYVRDEHDPQFSFLRNFAITGSKYLTWTARAGYNSNIWKNNAEMIELAKTKR